MQAHPEKPRFFSLPVANTATLLHDGQPVQTFTFTQPDAWYFYTAWADERLYFVGASVRYLDLDQLP